MDRYLKEKGIDSTRLNPLVRLSLCNATSFGGLEYRPSQKQISSPLISDYDRLEKEFRLILEGKPSQDIETLFAIGGSSGGSRPKAAVEMGDEPWLIKFRHRNDPKNIAQMEFDYLQTASECGILTPESALLSGKEGNSYFAIKRFDRECGDRLFAVSALGLLEKDASVCLLDYRDLFKLVAILSKENKEQLKQMYFLMCFNVLAKNQDDHGKNFSFLFDPRKKAWRLSPAYDLTYSPTLFGEQSTTVDGKGKDISLEDLAKLGSEFFATKKECLSFAKGVQALVEEKLSKYWG